MLFVFFQMYFIFQNQKVCSMLNHCITGIDIFISDKFLCPPLPLSARPDASHLNKHLCLAQRKVLHSDQDTKPLFQVLIIETKHDLEHRPHHQGAHQAGQHMGEGEEWSVLANQIAAFY